MPRTHQYVVTLTVQTKQINPAIDADHPIGNLSDPHPRRGRHAERRSTVNSVDAGLVDWALEQEGIEVVAVPRNADVKGFQVLPRRWVVERTFGWLTRCRRLSRDYERKTSHAEAMIQIAMIRLMAARLAGEEVPEPVSPVEVEAARRLAEDLND